MMATAEALCLIAISQNGQVMLVSIQWRQILQKFNVLIRLFVYQLLLCVITLLEQSASPKLSGFLATDRLTP
jgi:hypothetical protein